MNKINPTVEKAKQIIKDTYQSQKGWHMGTCCGFIKVSEEWGVKIYSERAVREYTWNLQNIAYKNIKWEQEYDTKTLSKVIIDVECHGDSFNRPLAPEPGEWMDTEEGYAYLTRIADIEKHQNEEDIESLCKNLRSIGIVVPNDDFRRKENLGYIEGNLTCIDFDAFYIKMLSHGGFLQYYVCRPQEPSDELQCNINEDIKEILKWKSE